MRGGASFPARPSLTSTSADSCTKQHASREIKSAPEVGVGAKVPGGRGGKLIERMAFHQSGMAEDCEDKLGRIWREGLNTAESVTHAFISPTITPYWSD